ncbi:HAD family phosphatase [Streptomyces sp. AC512_CC834]|uniref:HAD family hydrolase n=1 Tax=Streptomyces sp. AC512_CC834 TaxID=2823691 RepID=UPI001C253971|nr:HAD-IB family hydrolase [Streptomyces sp. AC512_CC834]
MHHRKLLQSSPRPVRPSRLAFFDLDETLLSGKSMIDFLCNAPESLWVPGEEGAVGPRRARGQAGIEKLADLSRRGADRAEMNRAYYQLYAGVALSSLRAAGQAWYTEFTSRPEPYVAAGVAALAEHRRAGHTVVLVSGSAHPFVDPAAEALRAELALCTELEVDDKGILTGRLTRTMIGADKARAVTELRESYGLAAEDCFAYGDHASDLAMLRAVGTAVVVGEDPVLLRHARQQGWSVLPGTAGNSGGEFGPTAEAETGHLLSRHGPFGAGA